MHGEEKRRTCVSGGGNVHHKNCVRHTSKRERDDDLLQPIVRGYGDVHLAVRTEPRRHLKLELLVALAGQVWSHILQASEKGPAWAHGDLHVWSDFKRAHLLPRAQGVLVEERFHVQQLPVERRD